MNRSDRRAKLALITIVGLIVVVFALKTTEPYRMGRQAHESTLELAVEVEELKRSNEAKESRLRALQSERGIEIEARRHSYIRPTEVPVQVSYDDGVLYPESEVPTTSGESDPEQP